MRRPWSTRTSSSRSTGRTSGGRRARRSCCPQATPTWPTSTKKGRTQWTCGLTRARRGHRSCSSGPSSRRATPPTCTSRGPTSTAAGSSRRCSRRWLSMVWRRTRRCSRTASSSTRRVRTRDPNPRPLPLASSITCFCLCRPLRGRAFESHARRLQDVQVAWQRRRSEPRHLRRQRSQEAARLRRRRAAAVGLVRQLRERRLHRRLDH